MCFYNDGSYPEFARDRPTIARVPHRCTECGGAIAKGDEYHRHSGKFDGSFYDEKVCRRCDYDRARVVRRELDEGCDWDEAWPPLGDLAQALHDSDLGQTRPEDVPAWFRVGDLIPADSPEAVALTPGA